MSYSHCDCIILVNGKMGSNNRDWIILVNTKMGDIDFGHLSKVTAGDRKIKKRCHNC